MENHSDTDIGDEARKIIDKIDGHDALAVLKTLADKDPDIAKEIAQTASAYLEEVDVEDVASQIYVDLDSIQVEEVWEQSGASRHGYVEPTEKAWELFEEALRPHRERMEMYEELSMPEEAKSYCMGILAGIHRFEEESTSEYKDWAVDAPKNYFNTVLDRWRKECERSEDVQDVEEFVRKNAPEWL